MKKYSATPTSTKPHKETNVSSVTNQNVSRTSEVSTTNEEALAPKLKRTVGSMASSTLKAAGRREQEEESRKRAGREQEEREGREGREEREGEKREKSGEVLNMKAHSSCYCWNFFVW